MSDIFANLRSGVQFPQVVMNQGPMPGTGGLPRPLHDSVDGRINYNSSLLGDLTPYAYGEPGYLSSQTAYLNIPHKLQKLVPPVFLPEAKPNAKEFFDLSHPVDDGDLAFTLRLDRNSIFCTGLRTGASRRATTGTAIDPLVNLATVNYILSGVQLCDSTDDANLWVELFQNLDAVRKSGTDALANVKHSTLLDMIVRVVRECIRPFGIARGSERQGGQNESTPSPATWPVSFVTSVTLDGKESNVMNMWHHLPIGAGDDLVLRLKLMPLCPYTLNHYYKGVKRQSWGSTNKYVWQLVPDKFHLDPPSEEEKRQADKALRTFTTPTDRLLYASRIMHGRQVFITPDTPWQELGYWHIGRAQIMSGKYGVEEYWHNDLANGLRTNHLDMTLQPMFAAAPMPWRPRAPPPAAGGGRPRAPTSARVEEWKPRLALERLPAAKRPAPRVVREEPRWDEDLALPAPAPPVVAPVVEEDLGLDLLGPAPLPEPAPVPPVEEVPPAPRKGRGKKGGAAVGGTLLRPDGSSEPSMVGML